MWKYWATWITSDELSPLITWFKGPCYMYPEILLLLEVPERKGHMGYQHAGKRVNKYHRGSLKHSLASSDS